MSQLLKLQLNISINDEIKEATEMAAGCSGLKVGTLCRRYIVNGLMQDGFMKHPMHDKLVAAKAAQAAQAK